MCVCVLVNVNECELRGGQVLDGERAMTVIVVALVLPKTPPSECAGIKTHYGIRTDRLNS